uniref:hypothetical protein n=1 Tax=Polaromonas sp. TaxID=1869339 RepID=UPI0015EF2C68|nr:hypothetical protein [Polaromonas sp.]
MKIFSLIFSVVTMTFISYPSAIAATNCQHYELAEIKQMSKDMLKLNYCLFEIRKESILKQGELSNQQLLLEANYGRFEGLEIERIRNKKSDLDQAYDSCGVELGRLATELSKKKINPEVLKKSC